MQQQTVWADLADREAEDCHSFRGLWALMIRTAVKDLKSGDETERESALRWINDEDKHPLSFGNLCEVLGIDAGRARQKIMSGHLSLKRRIH